MAEAGVAVGIAFLVASCGLVTEGLSHLRRRWIAARERLKKIRKVEERLECLDPHEQAVLREFYIQRRDTLRLPANRAVVAGLINKGIIAVVGNMGEISVPGALFPCTITEVADAVLTPEDISLPEDPTDDEVRLLQRQRPDFLEGIAKHDRVFHDSW